MVNLALGFSITTLLLVIFWNYMQGKRIDELQKRLDSSEKK